jgi:hypothetical protein
MKANLLREEIDKTAAAVNPWKEVAPNVFWREIPKDEIPDNEWPLKRR